MKIQALYRLSTGQKDEQFAAKIFISMADFVPISVLTYFLKRIYFNLSKLSITSPVCLSVVLRV
jgi:hypothetical protein